MMTLMKITTAAAVLFTPADPPKEAKPAISAAQKFFAVQGEQPSRTFLLDAVNMKQNCGACHSPTPDSKAVVCPKGHGTLNLIEYHCTDSVGPTKMTVSATGACTAAPGDRLGLTLKPVGDGLRTHLKLAADAGVLVEEVAKDSVLADVDVKKYDVLVAVDDVAVKEPEKAVDLLLTCVKDEKSPTMTLVREGKPLTARLQLTPPLRARLLDATKPAETRYRIGVSLANVDETLRQHLKIPSGEGAVVTSVEAGSAAADATIKQHDILLRWDKTPIASSEGLIEIIQKHGAKPAVVHLFREGKLAAKPIIPKPLPLQAEVRFVEGQLMNRVAGEFVTFDHAHLQPPDAAHSLMGSLYIANLHAIAGDATLEGELAAALAQTKALQTSLERLQAKVVEAKKTKEAKPPVKK